MQPISRLARLGSSHPARLIFAAALAVVMLPALPGTTLAKPYTAMSSRLITLIDAPEPGTHESMSGTVTFTAGTSYNWTEGFFRTTGSSASSSWLLDEPIVASTISPGGGMYSWTCWLDGYPIYSSGCSMQNVSTPESYSMSLGSFGGRAATLNWQVSFVPTSRTRGQTRSQNLFPSGQCTYGAERQFYLHFTVYPEIRGDAKYWDTDAKSHGWTVTNEPESNSVVVWEPGIDGALSTGHVAWVEGIEYRAGVAYIHTSELNIATGQGNTYRHRILKASALAGRNYILGTR